CVSSLWSSVMLFCTDAATVEISTLSLHDALPISGVPILFVRVSGCGCGWDYFGRSDRRSVWPKTGDLGFYFGSCALYAAFAACRSEEHTSELQSRENLVCRLLLEKKKKTQ